MAGGLSPPTTAVGCPTRQAGLSRRAASERVVGLLWVGTVSSSCREAVAGATRTALREAYGRSTSYSGHSATAGRRAQRLLGVSQRAYARQRPASADVAMPSLAAAGRVTVGGRERQSAHRTGTPKTRHSIGRSDSGPS